MHWLGKVMQDHGWPTHVEWAMGYHPRPRSFFEQRYQPLPRRSFLEPTLRATTPRMQDAVATALAQELRAIMEEPPRHPMCRSMATPEQAVNLIMDGAVKNYAGGLRHGLTLEQAVNQEQVNHPGHYGGDTVYEVIKVLEAWRLDFHLGNVVKYVARAGKKDQRRVVQDLEKAAWYLQRRIDQERKRP